MELSFVKLPSDERPYWLYVNIGTHKGWFRQETSDYLSRLTFLSPDGVTKLR